jgi:hypothetical protein
VGKKGTRKEETGRKKEKKGTILLTTILAATVFPCLVPGPNTLSCKPPVVLKVPGPNTPSYKPLVVFKPVVGSQNFYLKIFLKTRKCRVHLVSYTSYQLWYW